MLEKLRSYYIKKKLFLYLDEVAKLKLIQYNKKLQSLININLLNYQIISGKYLKNGENGIVKEYDSFNDAFIFEGKYSNGKRNGKGKEYELDELIFEGEYINGKRNGKGKEYDNFGNLIFEGEYINGKKWNGKFYDKYNKAINELKEGKGYIKEYSYDNKLKFQGNYINGERNGKGKEYDTYGNIIFNGVYKNGKRWNGKGYDDYGNIIFKLKNGKGLVKEYYYQGSVKFVCEYW